VTNRYVNWLNINWQGKKYVLGEKPVATPLCTAQNWL